MKKYSLSLIALIAVFIIGAMNATGYFSKKEPLAEGCNYVLSEADMWSAPPVAGPLGECIFFIKNSTFRFTFFQKNNEEDSVKETKEIREEVEKYNPYNTSGVIEVAKKGLLRWKSLQTITVDTIDPFFFFTKIGHERFFVLEDVNFDGYKDVRVIISEGATGNGGFAYYVFDPKRAGFFEDPRIGQLSNPRPDPETKTITEFWKVGNAGRSFLTVTYFYNEKGELVVKKRVNQDVRSERAGQSDEVIRITEELVDGTLKVTKTEYFGIGDPKLDMLE